MGGKLLFLGTGGSMGVPVIGCSCKVCRSKSSRNKRSRSSVLIQTQGKNFLIDAGPDFREQALKHKIRKLDGLLLTHTHFDHVAGIDDLRAFYFLNKTRLPCLLSKETFEEIKIRYHYLMRPLKDGHSISAQLDFFVLDEDFGKMRFQGVEWKYMSYTQADMKVTGFRQGKMAYISDIRAYTNQLLKSLEGVETLILSALRTTPTQMHFSVDEAIEFSKMVGAKKTYLTHISHDLEHTKVNKILPSNVRLSYDGLKISYA